MLKFHWGPARGTDWIQENIKSFTDPIHLTWVISLSDEICAYDVCKLFYLQDKLCRDASNFFLTSYMTLKHKNGTASEKIEVLPQKWEIKHNNIDTISNRCDVPKSTLLSHCNWSITILYCHSGSTWEKDQNDSDTGADILSSVRLMFGLCVSCSSRHTINMVSCCPARVFRHKTQTGPSSFPTVFTVNPRAL